MLGLFSAVAIGATTHCDPASWQASVDRLEDQAFTELKAANEAVATAARNGSVGAAGDVQWAKYKALRAQAEQRRVEGFRAQTACGAPTGAEPLVAASSMPAGLPVADASRSKDAPKRRFAVQIEGAGSDIDFHPLTTLKRASISGVAWVPTGVSSSPYVPPSTSTPSSDWRQGIYDVASATPAPSVPLRGRAWSNDESIAVSFAPRGIDQRGFRFDYKLGLEEMTLKQFSGQLLSSAPNIGTLGTPVFHYTLCTFGPVCSYVWMAPGPFSAVMFQSLDWPYYHATAQYNERQNETVVRSDLRASYQTPALTPWALNATGGFSLGVAWYTVKDVSTFETSSDSLNNPAPIRHEYNRKASGPSARVAASIRFSGRFIPSLPLTWAVRGETGYEFVDLDVQNTLRYLTQFSSGKQVSSYGARLSYEFGDGLSAAISAERRKDFYVSITPEFGAPLNDGSGIDLRTIDATRYSFGVQYAF